MTFCVRCCFRPPKKAIRSIFKEEVGYTPHEYITMLRINRAKELLKSTDFPMSEIALRVGYEYPTSFTAVFQKKVGVTPREFRKMPI